MLRAPLQGLKNEHVECSLQELNAVFILVFLVHGCRHSTHSGSRLSTAASWRRLNSKPCLCDSASTCIQSKVMRGLVVGKPHRLSSPSKRAGFPEILGLQVPQPAFVL